MKQLVVNEIINDRGVTHGIVGSDRIIKENLLAIYGVDKLARMLSHIVNNGQPTYFLDSYCQYVLLVQFDPIIGFSMKISDYHNNLNAALDEYNELSQKGWKKTDRDRIMRLFEDIEKNTNVSDRAKMIVSKSFL